MPADPSLPAGRRDEGGAGSTAVGKGPRIESATALHAQRYLASGATGRIVAVHLARQASRSKCVAPGMVDRRPIRRFNPINEQ